MVMQLAGYLAFSQFNMLEHDFGKKNRLFKQKCFVVATLTLQY